MRTGESAKGAGGVLRTGLVGLVLALVVLGTGSLYAAVVMHAVLDLVQGRLLAVALRQELVVQDSEDSCTATSSPIPQAENI